MENFDRENIDELLEIRQIRQYFPPSKLCAVQYSSGMKPCNNICHAHATSPCFSK